MSAEAAARRWADVWARAWPAADAEAILALYEPDAVYVSQAFRAPTTPAEYVRWAFAEQAGAECRFGEPIPAGARAAVDWWGVITSTDGTVETIAGTSLLRFSETGRVVEQRDVWEGQPGRHELPMWANASA